VKNRKGKAAVIDSGRCIGCGVCAYKCPTRSLTLIPKTTVTDPPQDPRDSVNRFLMQRGKYLEEKRRSSSSEHTMQHGDEFEGSAELKNFPAEPGATDQIFPRSFAMRR
jgi:formate hydrogenlyase subunit 6/NADH:ubiquinone oxidoreductase subunit I